MLYHTKVLNIMAYSDDIWPSYSG